MVQIEFDFNQIITEIQGNLEDLFQDMIDKYINKTELNPDKLTFFANGKKINPEKTVESQMSYLNKTDNKMKVLVNLINEENKDEVFVKSKEIICPKCYEPCKFKIENYKIKLYDCVNNHEINNIKILKEFLNTQKINISNIICDKCKVNNRGKSYNHEFYKCLTCSQNLCPLCKTKCDPNHNIIKYDQINYICQAHNDYFIKYCTKCKLNICIMCDKDHKDHETIFFGDLMPNLDTLKEKLSGVKQAINTFNEKIKNIIRKLNELSEAIDIYYNIQNEMVNNYDMKNKNYNSLFNINQISLNDEILEKLKNINQIQNLTNEVFNIIDLYNKLNLDYKDIKPDENINTEQLIKESSDKKIEEKTIRKTENDNYNQIKEIKEIKTENKEKNKINKEKLNEMSIICNVEKNMEKIKIFGDNFVTNNKNNCYIVIEGKEEELCSEIILNEKQKENNILEIKLIVTKVIANISNMFDGSVSLQSLPDIDKWDTKNVNNMNNMFKNCKSLKSLPDISKWNTKNVTDMSYMFSGCKLL